MTFGVVFAAPLAQTQCPVQRNALRPAVENLGAAEPFLNPRQRQWHPAFRISSPQNDDAKKRGWVAPASLILPVGEVSATCVAANDPKTG
jgi:hypothetical protein